jgi:hypothetical protein
MLEIYAMEKRAHEIHERFGRRQPSQRALRGEEDQSGGLCYSGCEGLPPAEDVVINVTTPSTHHCSNGG